MKFAMRPPGLAYRQLQKQLAALGWICPGSVQRRRQLGTRKLRHPIYQWTRKVKGKTVTVNLTADQYQGLRIAIANQRRLTQLIAALHKLTMVALFKAQRQPPN
jgi:hypothetical protein